MKNGFFCLIKNFLVVNIYKRKTNVCCVIFQEPSLDLNFRGSNPFYTAATDLSVL